MGDILVYTFRIIFLSYNIHIRLSLGSVLLKSIFPLLVQCLRMCRIWKQMKCGCLYWSPLSISFIDILRFETKIWFYFVYKEEKNSEMIRNAITCIKDADLASAYLKMMIKGQNRRSLELRLIEIWFFCFVRVTVCL